MNPKTKKALSLAQEAVNVGTATYMLWQAIKRFRKSL